VPGRYDAGKAAVAKEKNEKSMLRATGNPAR